MVWPSGSFAAMETITRQDSEGELAYFSRFWSSSKVSMRANDLHSMGLFKSRILPACRICKNVGPAGFSSTHSVKCARRHGKRINFRIF